MIKVEIKMISQPASSFKVHVQTRNTNWDAFIEVRNENLFCVKFKKSRWLLKFYLLFGIWPNNILWNANSENFELLDLLGLRSVSQDNSYASQFSGTFKKTVMFKKLFKNSFYFWTSKYSVDNYSPYSNRDVTIINSQTSNSQGGDRNFNDQLNCIYVERQNAGRGNPKYQRKCFSRGKIL